MTAKEVEREQKSSSYSDEKQSKTVVALKGQGQGVKRPFYNWQWHRLNEYKFMNELVVPKD